LIIRHVSVTEVPFCKLDSDGNVIMKGKELEGDGGDKLQFIIIPPFG